MFKRAPSGTICGPHGIVYCLRDLVHVEAADVVHHDHGALLFTFQFAAYFPDRVHLLRDLPSHLLRLAFQLVNSSYNLRCPILRRRLHLILIIPDPGRQQAEFQRADPRLDLFDSVLCNPRRCQQIKYLVINCQVEMYKKS